MAQGKRKALVENLAVGSAIGLLTIIAAAISFTSDLRAVADEGKALEAAFAATGAELSSTVDDQRFERLFSMRLGKSIAFGTIIALRSPGRTTLVGALFSPNGQLRGLRHLGAGAESPDIDVREVLRAAPGAEESLDRAAEAVRAAAGTRESGS